MTKGEIGTGTGVGGTVLAILTAYQTLYKGPAVEAAEAASRENASVGIVELMQIKDAQCDRLMTMAIDRCDIRVNEIKELLGH